MSHGNATCTACGHKWELRKPHTEIDVLRCSACGTTGSAISVTGTPPDTVDPDELSVVDRLRVEEHRVELRTRAERITTDIQELGGGSAPADLEPEYMALDTLIAELDGDKLIAPAELEAIAEYLTAKEEDIYTRETVTKVTDLEQRIEDLTQEIEQLEADKEQLTQVLRQGPSLPDRE